MLKEVWKHLRVGARVQESCQTFHLASVVCATTAGRLCPHLLSITRKITFPGGKGELGQTVIVERTQGQEIEL